MPANSWCFFNFIFGSALPLLIPGKVRKMMVQMNSDKDKQQYGAFLDNIPEHHPHAFLHLCMWHMIYRDKMNTYHKLLKKKSVHQNQIFEILRDWIKSWGNYVKTMDEYTVSKQIFDCHLSNSTLLEFQELGK